MSHFPSLWRVMWKHLLGHYGCFIMIAKRLWVACFVSWWYAIPLFHSSVKRFLPEKHQTAFGISTDVEKVSITIYYQSVFTEPLPQCGLTDIHSSQLADVVDFVIMLMVQVRNPAWIIVMMSDKYRSARITLFPGFCLKSWSFEIQKVSQVVDHEEVEPMLWLVNMS